MKKKTIKVLTSKLEKKIIIVLFLLTQLLISCGTKGSLYIPEERYPQNDSFNKQDNNDLSNFSVT